MRYRATILFLLGGLFAFAPYLHWHQEQARCIAQYGRQGTVDAGLFSTDSACAVVKNESSPGMQALGVMSVVCFAGFLYFFIQGIAARRREQAFLHAAGVDVPEEDLPIEE